MGIKVKSVAFNLDDPDQYALFEHTKLRTSFSGYVKRLIQRDMEGGGSSPGFGSLLLREGNFPEDRELMRGLT